MAFGYWAGFDISELTLGTLTMATSGQSDVVITFSSMTGTDQNSASTSLMFPGPNVGDAGEDYGDGWDFVGEDPDSTVRLETYADVPLWEVLQAALRAEATTQSWPSPTNITCSQSGTTGRGTITYSAQITLTFSLAAGRRFLGYSADQTGSSSYTSDITPDYIILPTALATSDPTTNYEPAGVANHMQSDDGAGFGVSRTVAPLYRDWTQIYENKAKTLRLAAPDGTTAGDHPWTFQALIEHCRGRFPFIVTGGFGEGYDEAFHLRTEGTNLDWRGIRASPGNDAQFNIPFRCSVVGKVNEIT